MILHEQLTENLIINAELHYLYTLDIRCQIVGYILLFKDEEKGLFKILVR